MRATIFFLASFLISTEATADTCYATFSDSQASFRICEYSSSSGYIEYRNLSVPRGSLCWTIVYANGRQDNACNLSMAPGEQSSFSCYECNRSTNRVVGVRLRIINR